MTFEKTVIALYMHRRKRNFGEYFYNYWVNCLRNMLQVSSGAFWTCPICQSTQGPHISGVILTMTTDSRLLTVSCFLVPWSLSLFSRNSLLVPEFLARNSLTRNPQHLYPFTLCLYPCPFFLAFFPLSFPRVSASPCLPICVCPRLRVSPSVFPLSLEP